MKSAKSRISIILSLILIVTLAPINLVDTGFETSATEVFAGTKVSAEDKVIKSDSSSVKRSHLRRARINKSVNKEKRLSLSKKTPPKQKLL